MGSLPPPLTVVLLFFAGSVNREQQTVIDYLLEENRVLSAAHLAGCASPTTEDAVGHTAGTHYTVPEQFIEQSRGWGPRR